MYIVLLHTLIPIVDEGWQDKGENEKLFVVAFYVLYITVYVNLVSI